MGRKILVVGEIQGGALRKTSLEVLSAGRALAEKSSGSVDAALVGSGIDAPAGKLAAHGVGVKQLDGSAYASWRRASMPGWSPTWSSSIWQRMTVFASCTPFSPAR
jgi:hypothetical protein